MCKKNESLNSFLFLRDGRSKLGPLVTKVVGFNRHTIVTLSVHAPRMYLIHI